MITETKKKWNYTYNYRDQRAKYGEMNNKGRKAMAIALGITGSYVNLLLSGNRRMTEEHCRVADYLMQAQHRMETEIQKLIK